MSKTKVPTVVLKVDGNFNQTVADQIRRGMEAYYGQPAPEERQAIEQEAASLVRNGKRQGSYGHPRGDFDTIAKMWSAILSKFNQAEVKVEAEQVALMMIAMKLSRLARDPSHHDSRVDVIGYAICLDRLDEEVPAGRLEAAVADDHSDCRTDCLIYDCSSPDACCQQGRP